MIEHATSQLLTCHISLENVVQKVLPTKTLSLSLSPTTRPTRRQEFSPTRPTTTTITTSPKNSWTRTLGTVTVFADSSDSMTKSDDKIRQVNDVIGLWSGISLQQGIGEVLVTKFSTRLHLFSRAKVQSNGKLSFHDFTTASLQRSGSWDAPGVEIEKLNLIDATTDCLNSNLHPNYQTLGWNNKEYDAYTRKMESNEEGKRNGTINLKTLNYHLAKFQSRNTVIFSTAFGTFIITINTQNLTVMLEEQSLSLPTEKNSMTSQPRGMIKAAKFGTVV